LSCIELCEPSASRFAFKKWYELFTKKVADREAPTQIHLAIERKKLAIKEFVEPQKGEKFH